MSGSEPGVEGPNANAIKDDNHQLPSRVLCVHQGYELYGSDRTFISSVTALREALPHGTIDILLPKSGPLEAELRRRGFSPAIADLWIARKADGVAKLAWNALRLPLSVYHAYRKMKTYDVIYINTSVIFDYMIASRFVRNRVILHIHEIPTDIFLSAIKAVAGFGRAALIFNSEATMTAFGYKQDRRAMIVPNGVPPPRRGTGSASEPGKDKMRLLVIGRINAWKGQDLLIAAIRLLPEEIRATITLRILGDSFENGPDERRLRDLVDAAGLEESVSFHGFVSDPSAFYEWSEVVVVPSKKPEPFGLVAIEAMSHSKPVVAARHGGLLEIVQEDKTGKLFEPNNAEALAAVLAAAWADRQRFQALGQAGHAVYLSTFTEEAYKRRLGQAVLGPSFKVPF